MTKRDAYKADFGDLAALGAEAKAEPAPTPVKKAAKKASAKKAGESKPAPKAEPKNKPEVFAKAAPYDRRAKWPHRITVDLNADQYAELKLIPGLPITDAVRFLVDRLDTDPKLKDALHAEGRARALGQ